MSSPTPLFGNCNASKISPFTCRYFDSCSRTQNCQDFAWISLYLYTVLRYVRLSRLVCSTRLGPATVRLIHVRRYSSLLCCGTPENKTRNGVEINHLHIGDFECLVVSGMGSIVGQGN